MTIRDLPQNDRLEVHAHAVELMRQDTTLTRLEAVNIAVHYWLDSSPTA